MQDGVIKICQQIVVDVIKTLYQSLGFSGILAFFFMYFYMYCRGLGTFGNGVKDALLFWIKQFRYSKEFRKVFLLALYMSLVLFRTLLNRTMWLNPLSDVFGGWWISQNIFDSGAVVYSADCFENIILFIPLPILWFSYKDEEKQHYDISFTASLKKSIKCGFMVSLLIEMAQLFFCLGTFQISDIFYNVFGSFLGGLGYYLKKHQ